MGNKKKKRDIRSSVTPESIKKIPQEVLWRIALIAFNSVILTVVYFGFMQMESPILSPIVTVGFWVAASVMLIVFVVYNRGFTQQGVTIEMLPDSWSEDKKAEYLDGIKKRQKKSKWMLAVLIPLLVPIMLDAIVLFTWPIVQNLLGLS